MVERNRPADQIRLRMYNVGFGDCFLLEFPRVDDRPFRVLVDCGAHTAGYPKEGWRPADTVSQIITDITPSIGPDQTNPTGAALDVVIATHRHQDHVSGFTADAWSSVHVGEVWMPWTEDPADPVATTIRNRQSRLAFGLQQAFQRPEFNTRWTNPHMKDSLRALAMNSLTNEKAMQTLHRGFAGRPPRQFLSADPEPRTLEACPGLYVHVLGPSRNEAVIRDMDPPTGQSYLRFTPDRSTATTHGTTTSQSSEYRARGPFPRNLSMNCLDYEGDATLGTPLPDDIKAAASGMMRDDDLATAVSLEKAVNGTSLMLMFEYHGAFLLFPGDAQWGTWNAALNNPTSRDLLSKTTFYKVGHHGSHNATPVEFIEEVLDQNQQIWGAATSVHPVAFWPEIPRAPLLDQLGLRCQRIVRSDKPGRSADGYKVRRGGVGVDFTVPC